MSDKAKTSKPKRKERGLNVRITQEKKVAETPDVHINRRTKNADKKNTTKKSETKTGTKIEVKTADKKTAGKKVATKKTTAKKTTKKTAKNPVKKKVEILGESSAPAEKIELKKEKIEVKKEKVEAKEEKTIPVEEKIEVKEEKIIPVEEKVEAKEEKIEVKEEKVKKELKLPASFSKNVRVLKEKPAPEVILPENNAKDTESIFETLSLNTEIKGYEPKIITRDVARSRAEIENQPVQILSNTRTEKKEKPVLLVNKKTKEAPRKLSAKEIKEKEIKKAVSLAQRIPSEGKKRHKKIDLIGRFGWARLTLMITCAITAVFALVYFISITSADMSLRVAASQSGIEASYPDYIPRGYELSDVTSASGKVAMSFKSEDGVFSITEENSTWDSDALLNDYIRKNYDAGDYSVVVEQGLTIYMGTNWETWVNGGILYKLEVRSGSLTKKQLKSIATSL